MKKIFKYYSKKRLMITVSFLILLLFILVLNITFSAFTNKNENIAANIKVAGMNYNIAINGITGTKITISENKVTTSNLVISSLNNRDSKYELIYKVCSTSAFTSYINKPESLTIEYSSKTTDPISVTITSNGYKVMRIAITNTSTTTYYIQLDINAGYVHNTLALKNLITTEYNEEDVKIAAIIDGEVSTTFPTNKEYEATVTCTKNGVATNATGTATWNGSKWIVNITGVDTGQIICNINFNRTLKLQILNQGGGVATISAKGNPDFTSIATTSDTGLYASLDEYGTSYYYRGVRENLKNNLIFGGFQWKIIRINGDGSIRILYNGTEAQFNTSGTVYTTGLNTQIGGSTYVWNTPALDNKYGGYMFGGANGVASTTRAGAVLNETNSNAKVVVDNWYQINILGKAFESKIVDNLFCNDRQLQNEVGGPATGPGYGTATSMYAAWYRLYENKMPTLKCGLKNDRFTKNDTTLGNGALTYPAGIITADEIIMAGLAYMVNNTSSYLYTNQKYWTASPYFLPSPEGIVMWTIQSNGSANADAVGGAIGIRPVISVNSQTRVTGEGTATNPYRVI